MPKRSNPSTKIDKEKEVKKARTDDTAPINNVGFFGKLFGYRPATSAPPLTSSVANGKKKTSIASSSSRKEEVKSTKSNTAGSSSVGSNTLLKSLRDNAVAKKSQTSTNITTKAKAKNTKRESTTDLPVVPFPHLPLTESKNKKSTIKSTLLLVILAILNITSAVYIGILYSNNNITQFKYQMEINKLHDELRISQQEVDMLRYRMHALEDVADRKEKLLSTSEDGEEKREMMTSEERKAFIEEIRLLEDDRQKVMDELNKNLSAF